MEFSQLLATLRLVDGRGEIIIPADWMQGRSAFGGLQAALLVQAMRSRVPDAPPLRTLQTSFIAPIPQDQPLHIESQLLRRGRSAIQVEARLMLEQAVLCTAIGIFGSARTSVVEDAPRQRSVAATNGLEMPYIESLAPNFTRHFSMRWLEGGLPFSGIASAESVIALHHLDPAPTSEAHVVALADAVPPAALSLLKKPAPGSSLTWMLEFLDDHLAGQPQTGWRMDLTMIAARDGYTQQSALMWAPDGRAIALSRQTTVVFA